MGGMEGPKGRGGEGTAPHEVTLYSGRVASNGASDLALARKLDHVSRSIVQR